MGLTFTKPEPTDRQLLLRAASGSSGSSKSAQAELRKRMHAALMAGRTT